VSNKNLKQIYDRSCERSIPENKSNSGPSIKPSILGSPCLRKVYYSYNKAPEDIPFPLTSSRITSLGNAIGKMLFDAFDKQGVVVRFRKPDGTYHVDQHTGEVDFEFRLTSPELGIRLGKIDAVLILDDGLWLGEFKSINDRGFKELKAPKGDHTIQGVLYLYLFNKALKEGEFKHIPELAKFDKANGIRFLYYYKDKSELKEFFITTADELFRQIVLKIEQVKWFSENNQVPPPTEDYCRTCAYQFRCQKNKKAND
jgi:hypothetical protein